MAVEEQGQAPLRYMSVPEKIELGGGGGGGVSREPSGGGARYRPMKVPDKITLEPSSVPPPPVAAAALSSEEGGEGDETTQRLGVQSSTGFQPPEAAFMPISNFQGTPAMQMSDPGQALPALVDLERRVRTLEHQVQRLTNTVVSSRPSAAGAGSNRGNNFWTVVTFTGWVMVPLIVVFMYHFKKSI